MKNNMEKNMENTIKKKTGWVKMCLGLSCISFTIPSAQYYSHVLQPHDSYPCESVEGRCSQN